MRVLCISGSLRARSSNTALLRAARQLCPPELELGFFTGLEALPHFNPDLEGHEPGSVLEFRASLSAADAILISSPEYAHGIPGALKNALDWVVGSGELSGKPVALLNASLVASIAQASLEEVLHAMDARVISDPAFRVALGSNRHDEASILADRTLSSAVQKAMSTLHEHLRTLEP